MNRPPFTERKYELTATAVTLVFAYYALRASIAMSGFRQMFSVMGDDFGIPTFTKLIFEHSTVVTISIVALAVITVAAIWSHHRLAGLVAAVGIVSLGIGTHMLCSAALSPLFQMIQAMGQ